MDGLSDNFVYCLLQDQDGFMWIGTQNGLNKYDGVSFKTYRNKPNDSTSLSSDEVNCLFQDKRGDLWIGTMANGLNMLDKRRDQFIRYTPDPSREDWIPGNRINNIIEDKNQTLWIFFDNGFGMASLDSSRTKFKHYDFFNELFSKYGEFNKATRAVLLDKSDENLIWIGSTGGLLSFHIPTEKYTHYPHPHKPQTENGWYGIWALMQLNDSTIQAGFFGAGSDQFNSRTKQWSHFNKDEYDSRVVGFAKKSESEVWVAARNRGVAILNTQTQKQEYLPADPNNYKNIAPGYTKTVFSTGADLWVGGKNGLSHYDSKKDLFPKTEIPFREKEIGRVNAAIVRGNKVFVGGPAIEGLGEYDLATGQYTSHSLPVPFSTMSHLVDLGDKLLLCIDDRYLIRFNVEESSFSDYHRLSLSTEKRQELFILNMKKESPDKLLVGTYFNGVFEMNPSNYEIKEWVYENEENLRAFGVTKRDKGGYLVGSLGSLQIRDDGGRFIKEMDLNSVNREQVSIHSTLIHPNGKMYLGTSLGLIEKEGEKEILHSSYDGRNILSSPHEMKLDENNNIWIATSKGIFMFDPEANRFLNFGAEDGLNFGGFFDILPNNKLLISQYGGFSLIDIKSLMQSHKTPSYVTEISTPDGMQIWPNNNKIDIYPSQNNFSIGYSSPVFTHGKKVQFRYRLKGLEDQWIDVGTRRSVNLFNLDGGNYVFEVEAKPRNGSWGKPAILTLVVHPPFYRTWWFILVSILATGAMVYFFYKRHIARVIREEQFKISFEKKLAEVEMSALRAQMNPHFLFNCLNSISSYIIKKQPEEATEYLAKFSKLIRLILQNSKTSMLLLQDELQALRLYIEMESLRFDHQFQYEIDIDPSIEIEHIEIPPLIIQPYVENAIWHGLLNKKGEAHLHIHLSKKKDHLEVAIKDNGIGREEARKLKSKSATKSKSLGMSITANRLEMIKKLYGRNPEVRVTDLKSDAGIAEGTLINIMIPIYG